MKDYDKDYDIEEDDFFEYLASIDDAILEHHRRKAQKEEEYNEMFPNEAPATYDRDYHNFL